MWIEYNNNPAGRHVGDCAVRALSVALDADWEDTYWMIAEAGFNMCDMPSSNSVWGAVLRQNGFYREGLPNFCPDCYTVSDFARDNPIGVYVLGTGTHVICVVNGDWYDSWNSGGEIPAYFWTK